jgi:hypothetical protein
MATSDNSSNEDKPKRLYFKSYLKFISNSIGSYAFRNFYVETPEKGEFDALDDGDNSGAFFVSSVLVIFKKISGMHGTVASTIKDLQDSGWQIVDNPEPGDVIVWEARQYDDGLKEQIGFYVGDKQAISNSSSKKSPYQHDQNFGSENRKVIQIFRASWQ